MTTRRPPKLSSLAISQTAQWVLKPSQWLKENAERHGDAFSAQFSGFPPMVFMHHPQAIREIFTGDPDLFDASGGNEIIRPFLGDKSLLLQHGDKHRRQRRLLMPPFHGKRMRYYGHTIQNAILQATADWPIGETLSVHKTALSISSSPEQSISI